MGATLLLTAGVAVSQETSSRVGIEEVPPKAARYLDAVRRSPQPGLVFDRFCDAWLSEGSAESLEAFLIERSEAGDPADQLILGFYYGREGRNVEALRVFRDTLAEHPGRASVWYYKAQTEIATLDFDTALVDLDAALQAEPGIDLKQEILQLKGKVLVRVGRRDEALAQWNAVIEASPDDSELYEDLVLLQVEEGLFTQAVLTLDQLIERTSDPQKRIGRRLWRGDILQQANKKQQAIEVYESTLGEVGAGGWLEREILGQLEQVYRADQEMQGYVERLEELSLKHPQRIALSRRRARVLAELNRNDEALAQWKALLERIPGDRELRSDYAEALVEAGRIDEAVPLIESLVSDRPEDGEMRLRLASLYKQSKRSSDAVSQVGRFMEGSDGSVASYARGIRVLERLELNDAAESLAREMSEQFADDVGARETLTELLYRLGKTEEAVAMWRKAAAEADEVSALLQPIRALMSRGQAAAALESLEGRVEEMRDEPDVLAMLADAAMRTDKADVAVPWLRQWVSAADNIETMSRSVHTAARLARAAGADVELANELDGIVPQQLSDGESWLLAVLYEEVGDSKSADRVMSTWASAASEIAIRARADILRGRGLYGEAADILSDLVKQPGGARSDLLRELIDLYARDFSTDQALSWIERWKQTSPGSISPWLKQASLLGAASRNQDAIDALRRAGRLFADDVSVASQLAEAYAQAGQENNAVRVYWRLFDQAESIASKLSWVAKLATLTRFSDGGESVIAQLEKRRNQDRKDVSGYLALAEAYRVLDHYEKRRAALMEAVRIDPENLELLLAIAGAEQRNQDFDNAVATLRRALPLDKSNRVRQRLASLQVYLGDVDQALATLEDPDGQKPDVPEALSLADALMGADEWDAAADYLAARIQEEPLDYRIHYLRGVALSEAGQHDEAIRAFLNTLEIDQEPPSLNSAAVSFIGAYRDSFQKILPADAITLMMQNMAQHFAFSHRRGQQHFGFPGMGNAAVQVPSSLDDALAMTVLHLRDLSAESSDVERQRVASAMRERGVRLAELLLNMPINQTGGFGLGPEVLEEYPDEPAVLALSLLMSGFGEQALQTSHLENAYQQFEADRPGLALTAALNLYFEELAVDPESSDRWDQVEKLISRIDQPPDILVAMIGRFVGGLPGQAPLGFEIPDEQRRVLSSTMQDWYSLLDPASQMRPYVFITVSSSLMQQEDSAPFAQFVVEETRRHRERKHTGGGTNQMGMMMGHHAGQGAIQELNFPPQSLSSVPSEVIGLLGGNNMFGMPHQIDYAELLEKLPEDSPAELRALIAGAAFDGEAVEAALAPLLDGETPTLDAFILAASWAGKEGRPLEAARRMVRASYLPMSRSERTALDGAVVAYVLNATDQLDEELKAAAQRSALRLRRATTSYEDRTAVIEALAELGLAEEAERLEESLASSPPTQPSRGYGSSARALSGTDRIEKLLDEGREDDAVRIAAREVDTLAQNVMGGNVWMLQNSDAKDLLGFVEQRKLKEKIIASADPGPDARGQRQVRFAALLELLDETDRAKALYQDILDARPDAVSASQLVFIYLQQETPDPAAAADVISSIPARQQISMGNQMFNRAQQLMYERPEFLLQFTESVAIWIENIPDDKTEKFVAPWLGNMWMLITQASHFSGENVRALYYQPVWDEIVEADAQRVKSAEETKSDSADEPFERRYQRQRLVVHDRLATAMMRLPAYGEQAVERLAVSRQLRGEPVDDLIDGVETALSRSPRQSGMNHHFVFHNQYQADVRRLRPAAEIMAIHAASQSDGARIQKLVELIRSQRRVTDAQELEAYFTLYTADDESFIKAADGLLQILQRGNPMASSDVANSVIDAWVARGRPSIDLEPLLFETMENNLNVHAGGLGAMMYYAKQLADRDGSGVVAGLLERFATTYVGPKDRLPDLIDRHYQGHSWQANSVNGKMHTFIQAMRNVSESPAFGLAALYQLRPYSNNPKSAGDTNYGRSIKNVYQSFEDRVEASEHPEQVVISFLDGSPLLADAGSFCAFAVEGDRHKSLLGMLRNSSAQADQDTYGEILAAVIDWLNEQPDTLGRALTLSAIRNDDLASSLRSITPFQDAIAGLPPQDLAEVTAALPSLDELPNDADEAMRSLAGILLGAASDVLTQRAQIIFDTRVLQPHSNQAYELSREIPTLVLALHQAGDTSRALDLLAHWDMLLDKQNHQSGWFNGRESQQLIRQMINKSADAALSLQYLQLVVAAVNHEPLSIKPDSQLLDQLAQLFRRYMEGISVPEGEGRQRVKRLFAAVQQLSEQLGEQPAWVLLIPICDELSRGFDGDDYTSLAEQLSEVEAEMDGPAGALSILPTANAAVAAARLKIKGIDASVLQDSQGQLNQYLLYGVNHEAIPASARLGLVAASQNRFKDRFDPKVDAAATKLLIETIDLDSRLVSSGAVNTILSSALNSARGEGWIGDAEIVSTYTDVVSRKAIRGQDNRLQLSLPAHRQVDRSPRKLSEPRSALLMLQLALESDLYEEAERLLAAKNGRLATSPASWALLVSHGQYESAAKHIRQHMALARPTTVRDIYYDQALADEMAVLIEQFDLDQDNDLIFFIRSAFAALADRPDIGQNDDDKESTVANAAAVSWPSRAERLVELAEGFGSAQFASDTSRNAVLLMLSSEPEAVKILESDFVEATQNVTLESLALYQGDRKYVPRQLILASLIASVQRGESELIQKQIDALYKPSQKLRQDNWAIREELNRLKELVSTQLRSDDSTLTTSQLVGLRDAWAKILTPPNFIQHPHYSGQDLALLFVLFAIDREAEPAAFSEWFESQKSSKTYTWRRKPDIQRIAVILKKIFDRGEIDSPRRMAIIVASMGQGLSMSEGSVLEDLVFRYKLMSVDELATHREALVEPLGLFGEIGLASALARGKHVAADEVWDQAIDGAFGSGADDAIDDQRIMLLDRLLRNKEYDRGFSLAQSWHPDDPSSSKRVQDLLKKYPRPASEPESLTETEEIAKEAQEAESSSSPPSSGSSEPVVTPATEP